MKEWILPNGFLNQDRAWDCYLDKIDTIYVDVDDTIVELTAPLLKFHGVCPSKKGLITDYNKKIYEVVGLEPRDFWFQVAQAGPDFWESLTLTAEGAAILNFCQKLEKDHGIRWQLVTALVSDRHPECRRTSADGKAAWASARGFADRLTISNAKHAHAAPNKLLIDDCPDWIEKFRARSGHAVYFPQPWNVGTTLAKMFDEIYAPRFMK